MTSGGQSTEAIANANVGHDQSGRDLGSQAPSQVLGPADGLPVHQTVSTGVVLSGVSGPNEAPSNPNNLVASPLGQGDDSGVVYYNGHENGPC
jgi:hypothetical protein